MRAPRRPSATWTVPATPNFVEPIYFRMDGSLRAAYNPLVDSDEMEIYRYLEGCGGQFVSALEISRRAASRKRFQEEPKWATSPLHRLTDSGVIETNGKSQYRLCPKQTEEKPKVKRWISPHIQKILRDSGKQFDAMNPAPPESEK